MRGRGGGGGGVAVGGSGCGGGGCGRGGLDGEPSFNVLHYRMDVVLRLQLISHHIVLETNLVNGLVLLDVIPDRLKYEDIAHCVS